MRSGAGSRWWRRGAAALATALAVALLAAGGVPATAATVAERLRPPTIRIEIDGVERAVADNVRGYLTLGRYVERTDLTDAQVRRLADRAVDEAADALRPFGYYAPSVRSRTSRDDDNWVVRLTIAPGEPVRMQQVDVRVTGPGADEHELTSIAGASLLQPGARLDHAAYERLKSDLLRTALGVMPAVVVTGARQTGKSTLVEKLVPGDRRYRSLDDFDVRDAARRDPEALLGGDDPLTLDEVQREPGLLTAVKRAIDRDRRPGRFLLTGSTNLLLMRQVSESLAGRASYLTLWPMTRREQLGLARAGRWDELLATPEAKWRDLLAAGDDAEEDWQALALRGGFPTPALELKAPADRAIWFDGYVRTYLERDLQDLASISALPDFRRLMQAACLRVGQILNQTELGRDVGLPQPTVHRWLNLLETSYLLVRLPAYAVNRTKRLVKSPRIFWGDTGVALHLGATAPAGAHLENLVLHDLLAWRDARVDRVELAYWRTTIGEEVDFVIEAGGKLLPIEVKATSKPRLADCTHLRTFRQEYGRKARAGLLLHTGRTVEWLTPDVLAVPWWRVL